MATKPIGLPNTDALIVWCNNSISDIHISNICHRLIDNLKKNLDKISKLEKQKSCFANEEKNMLQRKCNAICAKLRQFNANHNDACNVIKSHGNTSDRQVNIVLSGKYNPSTAVSDDQDPNDKQFILHKTRDRCCTVSNDSLFSWLMMLLDTGAYVLGYPSTAYPVKTKIKFKDIDQLPSVLLLCRCMSNPRNPNIFCEKRIYSMDTILLESLTMDQKKEYLERVSEIQTQLMIQHYGENVGLNCIVCWHQFVDYDLITCMHNRKSYHQRNDIICPLEKCKSSWCRVCRITPYHYGKECMGHSDLYKDLIPEDATAEDAYDIRKNIKPCPRCKLMTNRIDGCAHMNCSGCKSHWCWSCLMVLHQNDPYKHKCNGAGDTFYDLRFREGNGLIIGFDGRPISDVDITNIPPPPLPFSTKGNYLGGVHK
jgi:hypothetical protein